MIIFGSANKLYGKDKAERILRANGIDFKFSIPFMAYRTKSQRVITVLNTNARFKKLVELLKEDDK